MEEQLFNVARFYVLATKLKYKIRSGWDYNHWNINNERIESIAEHVYGTCILALSIDSEFNTNLVSVSKVITYLISSFLPFNVFELKNFDLVIYS